MSMWILITSLYAPVFQVAMLLDNRLKGGHFVKYAGTLCGTQHGSLAAMYASMGPPMPESSHGSGGGSRSGACGSGGPDGVAEADQRVGARNSSCGGSSGACTRNRGC